MSFYLGLDLGQAADYTAIAVLERRDLNAPVSPPEWRIPFRGERPEMPAPDLAFDCRHLKRLPLNTSYPAVADHVTGLLESPQLVGQTKLVVDATGVGRPVVDLLKERGLRPVPVTITGGDKVTFENGWRVPKRDLVGAVQVLLQTDRIKFAEKIPEVPTLVRELLAFRVKIDPLTAHDSYGAGAWREGAHDDLVLAVAIAAWWARRSAPDDPRPYTIMKARP